MNKPVTFLLLLIVLFSCKKTESDFIWERTYGEGNAYFLESSSDSGFYACGESGGKPYFIRFDKDRNTVIDFNPEINGAFTSAWFDTSGYITGGNIDGKMLLMRHSAKGNKLWEKSFDAGFKVDFTELMYAGHGDFLALASAGSDSASSGATGLYFVRFDTTGKVITNKKLNDANFIAAQSAVLDNLGNIYLAITRKTAYSKPKASVAKYNDLFQKLWETELYNNPDFGAGSLCVLLDKQENVYVSGTTGVPAEGGIVDNSYVASLSNNGAIRWKQYLERSNSGSALIFDEVNYLVTLNKNCYILRKNSTDAGADEGILRTYSYCESEDTDAFGSDFALNYDKNYLLAGSKGGSFYLALKSSL